MYRFLLVDDEEALTRVVGILLQRSYPGSEVRAASTNAEALRVLDSFDPDLITTDFHHPGGTGVDLLARLRLDPRTRHTPVVLLTAAETRKYDRFRTGFNAVLTKPFNIGDLVGVVNRLLNICPEHVSAGVRSDAGGGGTVPG
jgi:two-component system phosphate regulon response regulator PhoB